MSPIITIRPQVRIEGLNDHPWSPGTSGDGTNMITPDAMSLGLSLSSDDDEGGSTDDKESKKHPTKAEPRSPSPYDEGSGSGRSSSKGDDELDDEDDKEKQIKRASGEKRAKAGLAKIMKKKLTRQCFKCRSYFASHSALAKHNPSCVFCPKCLRFRDYRHPPKCKGPAVYLHPRLFCTLCQKGYSDNRIARHMAKSHNQPGPWLLKDHPEVVTMEKHLANVEAEANNENLLVILASTDADKLSTREVIEVTRLLHAKTLSKSAILKYEATNAQTPPMLTLLEEVASFRRAHKSSGRIGAVADLEKLRRFDSMLDNAITNIQK